MENMWKTALVRTSSSNVTVPKRGHLFLLSWNPPNLNFIVENTSLRENGFLIMQLFAFSSIHILS